LITVSPAWRWRSWPAAEHHAAKATSDGEAPDSSAAADGGTLDAGRETAVVSDAAVTSDVLAVDADALVDVPSDAVPSEDVADANAADVVDVGAGADDAVSRSPSCRREFAYDWRAPLETSADPWTPVGGTQGTPSIDTTADEALLPRDSS
jgi:hypothetical protein